MIWFDRHPITRLIFVFVYLVAAIWILIRSFAWLNIIFSLLMLFGCYISLIKSGTIRDIKANRINNLSFDIVSILITLFLLVDVLFNSRIS
jgi:hypothetical protein